MNGHMRPSFSCDHDPMIFIYKLDPCSLKIHRRCSYELATWSLSKVIMSQTDGQTRLKLYRVYTLLRVWLIKAFIMNVVQRMNPSVNYCEMEFSFCTDKCRLLCDCWSDVLGGAHKQRSIVAASYLYVQLRNTYDSMISSSRGIADHRRARRLSIYALALCRSV